MVSEMQSLNAEKQTLEPSPGHRVCKDLQPDPGFRVLHEPRAPRGHGCGAPHPTRVPAREQPSQVSKALPTAASSASCFGLQKRQQRQSELDMDLSQTQTFLRDAMI